MAGPVRFHRPLVCCLGLLAGCATPMPPSESSLPVAIPQDWTAPVDATDRITPESNIPPPSPTAVDATGAPPADDIATSWIADFDDPALPALVAEALGQNFDLKAAAARVKAARARAEQAGAARLPDVAADLSASRAKSGASGDTSNSFELGANIGWEIDLWDRLGRTAEATLAEVEANRAGYRAARLALAANVARFRFDAIEAEQQLRLADGTVASFEESLKTIEQRYRLGIGAALDVRLARENLATARSGRQVRARDRDVAARSLEILLGRYPAGALDIPQDLPELRQAIPVGLPADLLNRRPDIVEANEKLLATEHRLAAARANRLPDVRLTASGGTASDALRSLMDWDALVWSLVGDLTQPIWKGEELSAQVALAEANQQQAWADYATVVLQAFREVESALTAQTSLTHQAAALRVAQEEAIAAAVLASDRYRQGLSDIVTLLSTQRREFEAKSALLATFRQRLHARIDLYLALGGGF
uniref:Efflux transporter, outer membrane factor (OMF) lipoprotein, NodT family n=1 Tax=Candidatus Kentrum eta TaxID=2126337 RepID=A0A450VIF6_9GAMM|nr:MAG: efflux transporter, outer membrane factor (OMF) lipoprotein, NodT family [Candidatus Kentron sp. H]VFK04594.1 MAG: efflux transporter, outer membrane factor (OMF) lipoprotein, NodT family [Candidatus Kentron sp. H]VFK07642.1 MAG: efflux transporter, outer membrane factor (OMF) lipoprotein, NodT family [Candidatus Kentron sp. H]